MLCLMMPLDLKMGCLPFNDWVDIHLFMTNCNRLIFNLFLDVIDHSVGQ